MKILVGCEESQAVCIELRNRGHEAYSCDILPAGGLKPEWHIQADVFWAIRLNNWDMGIFFPACTFLCGSGERWFKDQIETKNRVLVGQKRRDARERAINFVLELYNCGIPRVAIENPVGILSKRFRKPDQYIQPFEYGDPYRKKTCLWLRGLPLLVPDKIVEGREQKVWRMAPSAQRSYLRSKTYPGIARAMAEQWGKE